MELKFLKVIILFSLLNLTLIASMIPLKFIKAQKTMLGDRRRRQKRILSLLSCFGGGVFFATCILDLLPDVKEAFVQVLNIEHLKVSYPLAEFAIAVGFFLVLIIEQVSLHVKESHFDDGEHSRLIVEVRDEDGNNSYQPTPRINASESVTESGSVNQSDLEHSMHKDKSSHSKIRSIMLVVALSVHSIFEGLAIGLQTNTDQVLDLFIAVSIHKTILAFSLGLNLAQSNLSLFNIIKSNILFCVTSPIGIGIGIAITNMSSNSTPLVVGGILQGIACGTFLFVTFFEVLPHEFNHSKDRILKLLFVILGFSCIATVIYFSP